MPLPPLRSRAHFSFTRIVVFGDCDLSKMEKLLEVTDEERRSILKHYNLSEQDFKEKIDSLLEWYKKSGLPEEGKKIHSLLIMKISSKSTFFLISV